MFFRKLSKNRPLLRLLIVVVIVLLFIALVFYRAAGGFNGDFSEAYPQPIDQNGDKVLLFWTPFFTNTRWSLPADTVSLHCPDASCTFTNDHEHLASIDMYDSIIFHTARPFVKPSRRSPKQLYIFTQLESPENTENNFGDEHGFYNLTMSYRLDADILWSYNSVLDRETYKAVAPALAPKWKQIDTQWTHSDSNLMAMFDGKSKLAAWFVSNCKTVSARERLVKELQTHMPIDVFGNCGTMTCTRGNDECDKMLDRDYKFYFSFENSLCTDYVTEKFFNALRRDVIPVVFGGANYTRFAPPHSYIDAEQFANVTALADYLKHLSNSKQDYLEYFWWRRHYKIKAMPADPEIAYCDICHRISSRTTQYRTQIIGDINAYWRNGTCRKWTKIKF